MKLSTIATALLATTMATTAFAAPTADTVFVSKNIFTGNPEMPIARSMAVTGDTISCVSDTLSCKEMAGTNTRIIDNGENTIMASFSDTHMHTRLFGQTHGVMLNLFELNGKSTEEIEKAISDYANTLGPNEWVIGGGFSYNNFPDPVKERLDELVGGRPALISDNTQHNGWYSTKALEYLGIDENWTIPKGGYMPLGKDGKPTGHLREKAHLSTGFVEQHKLYSFEKQEESVKIAAKLMNAAGVTSALEAAGGSKEGSDDVYVRLAKKGELNLRHEVTGVFWGGHGDREQDLAMINELVERRAAVQQAMGTDSHDYLTMNTIKFAIDGTPGAYAHMEEPYIDGSHPGMNYSSENLNWIFDQLTEKGFRLMLHVEGDAAMRKSLDALDYADETGAPLDKGINHVFTHIDHATPSLISRMKQRGVTAQLQYHWGDATDEYFQTVVKKNVAGYILENAFNMHGMVVDSGIEYGAGPDAPTSPVYKPFDGIEIAMTRQPLGQPDGERLIGKGMTLEQALYGYTLGSVKILNKQHMLGSLEEGKKADIIVLDRDIKKQSEVNPHKLHETQVNYTFLDGNIVHQSK
ncbi:putative amidohydrolase [Shewanella sp. c952]|uniref:amidohydrolase n=1 Tax=Shewanella sp. c952 TaxID=2815913 RepID=UPI001BC23D49|nr:amidohydrolase family protein [Shewanella sp. c952]GIU19275.1 putative amidohydrolase [Shewanella sp. c952]